MLRLLTFHLLIMNTILLIYYKIKLNKIIKKKITISLLDFISKPFLLNLK